MAHPRRRLKDIVTEAPVAQPNAFQTSPEGIQSELLYENDIPSFHLDVFDIDRIVASRKTLANRKEAGALTAEQCHRLPCVARVSAAAEETFGNKEKADAWLLRGTTALDGESPLDLLDTEEGAREVETLLTRIGDGLGA